MTISAVRTPAAKGAAVLLLLAVAAFAALAVSTAVAGSTTLLPAALAPELRTHLGLHGAAAVGIWNAFMSPWAMALSLALVPLGFGTWALTIRLTFQALVRQLGKEAARKAALNFGSMIRAVWAIWRLDVLRRRRWWSTRMPGLLPTPRHVGMAIALLGAVAMLTAAVVVAVALSLVPAAAPEVASGAALLVLAAAATRLAVGLDPHAAVAVYESPDVALLSRTAVTGRVLVLARGLLRPAVPDVLATAGVLAAVLVGTLVSGVGIGDVRVLLVALLTWPVCGALSNATGVATLRLVLRLPARVIAPAVVSFDAASRVAVAGLLVVVAPAVVDASRSASVGGAVTALLGHPVAHGVLAVARGTALWVGVAVALLCLALACAVAAVAAPPEPLQTQRRLTEGVRWRLNVPFADATARASADKDGRLLVRRGLPAWQTTEGLLGALPFVVGLALVGQMVVAPGPDPSGHTGLLTLLANACAVVAVLGITSDSLLPFLTLDTDGPAVRVLKGARETFRRYLGARAAAGGTALALVTMTYVLLVEAVAPWPGASIIGVALMAGVAVAAEAVVVVAGSAHRPALFRPAVGIPELEPSVRLTSGVVLVGVIALTGPVVLLFARAPGPPGPIAVLLVLAVVLLPVPLARALAGTVHDRLEGGSIHAST